ncbi:MAG: hypothetical protein OXC60_19715 [Litoreibacter sp.]|nr:hypothetical protein [Litoreibacter sp.]
MGAAQADVTASEVWDGFKSQLALLGTIEASETRVSNVLSVSAIQFSAQQDDVAGSAALAGEILFTENADGTVSVDIPDGLKGRVSINAPFGQSSFDYALVPVGFAAVASGDAGSIVYTMEAERLTHALSNIAFDDDDRVSAALEIVTSGLKGGWSRSVEGDKDAVAASYRYDQVALAGSLDDEGSASSFNVNAVALGVATAADTTLPDGISLEGLEGFLTSGILFDSRTSYENFSYSLNAGGISAQASMGAGFIDAALDDTALTYETKAEDLKITANPSFLLPQIDLSFAQTQSQLRATIPSAGDAQDISTKLVYQDAVLSEGLWGLFDPQGHLPREPINLFLESEAQGGIEYLKDAAPLTYLLLKSDEPQPLKSIKINELYLNAAGAEFQGVGAFSFDNNDLESFAGFPRPEGSVDLNLSGGFGLLDNLAKTGLLPDAQAQGIKAMAGFFAKPGAEPDTLTSKIEITDEGRILANGVPIQ